MGVDGLAPRMWERWDATNLEKPEDVIKRPYFFYLMTSRQGQAGPAFFV